MVSMMVGTIKSDIVEPFSLGDKPACGQRVVVVDKTDAIWQGDGLGVDEERRLAAGIHVETIPPDAIVDRGLEVGDGESGSCDVESALISVTIAQVENIFIGLVTSHRTGEDVPIDREFHIGTRAQTHAVDETSSTAADADD